MNQFTEDLRATAKIVETVSKKYCLDDTERKAVRQAAGGLVAMSIASVDTLIEKADAWATAEGVAQAVVSAGVDGKQSLEAVEESDAACEAAKASFIATLMAFAGLELGKAYANPEAVKKFADQSFTLLVVMEKAMRANNCPQTAEVLRVYIDYVNNYGNEKT